MEAQLELTTVAAQMEKKPDAFMLLLEKIQHLPPDAMGKVLENYEKFLAIQAKQAYDTAMAELKKNMPAIVKSKLADMNGKYQYKYADLERDVCSKLDPVLEAHGFGYRWTTRESDKGVVLACILYHIQGHETETTLPPAPHDTSGGKNPVQAVGSTLSYLQRYSLLMALGIAPKNVDTDGAAPTGGQMDRKELAERLEHFPKCETFAELEAHWKASYLEASKAKDQRAKDSLNYAKNTRKEELRKAGAQ